MTISFMVLGAPRSGTTWAANWLTTNDSLCLHDPLLDYTVARLQRIDFPGKRWGISCTASILYPEFVNAQHCPKIFLYRHIAEVNASLQALGLTEINEAEHFARVDALKNIKVLPYEQLFRHKSAKAIAKYLGVPFCPHRFESLRQMRVEPMWRHVTVNREAAQELVRRLAKEIE